MGTKDNCNAKHKKVRIGRIKATTLIFLDQEAVFLDMAELGEIIPELSHRDNAVWLFKDNLGKFIVTEEIEIACSECSTNSIRFYPVKEDEVNFEPDDPFEVLCRTCYYRKTQRLKLYKMVEGLK